MSDENVTKPTMNTILERIEALGSRFDALGTRLSAEIAEIRTEIAVLNDRLRRIEEIRLERVEGGIKLLRADFNEHFKELA
jgi:hypothetical protein